MKAVVQRVRQASVSVGGEITGEIGCGLMVLLGIGTADTPETARWMADKLAGLRIFADAEGKMNLSAAEVGGGLLIVSNFTLYGDARKGFRPSFTAAAPPDIAGKLYDYLIAYLHSAYPVLSVATGVFGAMMDVALINDGPVTILLEK
jgi:D-tyrosyl-tRNA(Tyr) deacylase